jgi:hypothetical protein
MDNELIHKLALDELNEEELRREIEEEKQKIRDFRKGFVSKIIKLFTTHKLVIRMEKRK